MDDKDLGIILLGAQGWAGLFTRAMSAGKPAGVTAKTQIDVLVSLSLNGPQSMGALSKRLERAPEQTSRAVKHLKALGLVACSRSPENHRVVVAELTGTGSRQIASYLKAMHDSVWEYLSGLDDPDREWMLRTAEQTIDIMRKHPLTRDAVTPVDTSETANLAVSDRTTDVGDTVSAAAME
ncbi:MarR family winged helix-turn-helix transcriptional regulator [Bifidobacterium choloepi]|uniref:MarR family transcriptional regulator n=1 Tax=Bifidobacterium choloepi TaxID=2614131 RepID=A0A6I5MYP7_9BIFI|nr:MarR family transcriptional regulator [Bifidobacterium choloepi]NEG69748.1 MarR family transcriptional regulator [Bifidobacterium choloepi]